LIRNFQEGDPKPKIATMPSSTTSSSNSTGLGIGLYAIILIGAGLAFGAYKYMQSQEGKA